MIEFRDAEVRYPRAGASALRGVTLEATRGIITAVAGPNGSGKSTLVRALIGTVPLRGGEILVDGQAVPRRPAAAMATRIAVVTQREEPVFPVRVYDYVALGRYPHGTPWRGASHADGVAVSQAIELAEVSALADRDTDQLSGGEWQRVRIARALAQQGEALVLDEPTTFLDIAHEMALFELLHRLASGGQAVLLVSHQLNLVARFASAMVLLHEGEVAAAGSPDQVMNGTTLEKVYGWPVVVTRDPAVGAPALVPLRSRKHL